MTLCRPPNPHYSSHYLQLFDKIDSHRILSGTDISPEQSRCLHKKCPNLKGKDMTMDSRISMHRCCWIPMRTLAGTCCVALVTFMLTASVAQAQSRDKDKDKDRKDMPSGQQLETRVTKAEEALLKEYTEVANEYYRKGEKEEAVNVLHRILQINPKMEGVQKQIDSMNEEMLQENGIKTELDVSKGWVLVCEVEADKPFRLAAVGEYKFDFATSLPLTGLPTADPAKDHIASAPFGALIGLVVTDGKPNEPFPVNAGVEHTPKKGGQLFLRVNVPVAAKCKGEIKIQLSGGVKPLSKRR